MTRLSRKHVWIVNLDSFSVVEIVAGSASTAKLYQLWIFCNHVVLNFGCLVIQN